MILQLPSFTIGKYYEVQISWPIIQFEAYPMLVCKCASTFLQNSVVLTILKIAAHMWRLYTGRYLLVHPVLLSVNKPQEVSIERVIFFVIDTNQNSATYHKYLPYFTELLLSLQRFTNCVFLTTYLLKFVRTVLRIDPSHKFQLNFLLFGYRKTWAKSNTFDNLKLQAES